MAFLCTLCKESVPEDRVFSNGHSEHLENAVNSRSACRIPMKKIETVH